MPADPSLVERLKEPVKHNSQAYFHQTVAELASLAGWHSQPLDATARQRLFGALRTGGSDIPGWYVMKLIASDFTEGHAVAVDMHTQQVYDDAE